MAGTRHHYIPRFLLKGFASHADGKEFFAWVYRADRQPFCTNIINIGIEGHFYTLDGRPEVDDSITVAEGRFAAVIASMRETREFPFQQREVVAELLAHLEIRTRHLRSNFERLSDAILARTIEFLSDKRAFSLFVLKQLESRPELLVAPLEEELSRRGLTNSQALTVIKALTPVLPAYMSNFLPGLAIQFSDAMYRMRTENPSALLDVARRSQLRALSESVSPQVKVQRYQALEYEVHTTHTPTPLGDSAVVFEVEGRQRYKTFVSASDTIQAVYLPIEPNLILCGRSLEHEPDLGALPTAVATCSSDYFVGHGEFDEYVAHKSLIGQSATILDDETLARLFQEAFQ
jgi:hypothetical protein